MSIARSLSQSAAISGGESEVDSAEDNVKIKPQYLMSKQERT